MSKPSKEIFRLAGEMVLKMVALDNMSEQQMLDAAFSFPAEGPEDRFMREALIFAVGNYLGHDRGWRERGNRIVSEDKPAGVSEI